MKNGFSVVFLLILVVVVGALIWGFITLQNSSDSEPGYDEDNILIETSDDGPGVSDGLFDIMQNPDSLIADLKDVSGGDSSGIGYVFRGNVSGDNVLFHLVNTDLPDPSGNDFYEGWLVQQKPLKFVSTGDLSTKGPEGYSLSYTNKENQYEGYDFVVITLETVKDDTPEKHILEGLAE